MTTTSENDYNQSHWRWIRLPYQRCHLSQCHWWSLAHPRYQCSETVIVLFLSISTASRHSHFIEHGSRQNFGPRVCRHLTQLLQQCALWHYKYPARLTPVGPQCCCPSGFQTEKIWPHYFDASDLPPLAIYLLNSEWISKSVSSTSVEALHTWSGALVTVVDYENVRTSNFRSELNWIVHSRMNIATVSHKTATLQANLIHPDPLSFLTPIIPYKNVLDT